MRNWKMPRKCLHSLMADVSSWKGIVLLQTRQFSEQNRERPQCYLTAAFPTASFIASRIIWDVYGVSSGRVMFSSDCVS